MKWTTEQIAELLDGKVVGNPNLEVTHIAPLDAASEKSISFLSNPKYKHLIGHTGARAILVGNDVSLPKKQGMTLIQVEDPYLAIAILHTEFERIKSKAKTGIENPVFIGKNSEIKPDIYLGAFSYIGKRVKLGQGVKIYPQVHIGDGCSIGDRTVIYPGAKIYENTEIGHHCTIQAGAVIGSHGFGFAALPDGSYKSIPQAGNVKIGDHVDIGANTTIDCATFGATVIGPGVKIDNLVQIAHNVKVGTNTVIAAQAGISGSASIGENVMIGGQVGTVGHIHIADKTKVGARSGVTKDTKSGQTLFGVPAMDRNAYLKSYAVYKKLPELMARIENLERNTVV